MTGSESFISRWFHHYTRGLIALVVIALFLRLLVAIIPADQVERAFEWLSSGPAPILIVGFMVVVVPALLGWLARTFVYPRLAARNEFLSLLEFEHNLVETLEPDDNKKGNYTVVIADWPSAEMASVGIATSLSLHPDNGAEMAAVFFPKAADIAKGDLRMVPRDRLHATDWSLSDLLSFVVSYGAIVPNPLAPSSDLVRGRAHETSNGANIE